MENFYFTYCLTDSFFYFKFFFHMFVLFDTSTFVNSMYVILLNLIQLFLLLWAISIDILLFIRLNVNINKPFQGYWAKRKRMCVSVSVCAWWTPLDKVEVFGLMSKTFLSYLWCRISALLLPNKHEALLKLLFIGSNCLRWCFYLPQSEWCAECQFLQQQKKGTHCRWSTSILFVVKFGNTNFETQEKQRIPNKEKSA